MVNLNCLPSDFLLARTSPDQIIAEIEEDFGFTSAVRDPFEDILDDLTGQLLSDPFKLTVGDSFGLSVGYSGNNRNATIFEGWYGNLHADRPHAEPTDSASAIPKKRKRNANLYPLEFGDHCESNWYRKYLSPEVRDRTYVLSSRDRMGEFRCLFRMPLKKVDELVAMFLERGWINKTRKCSNDEQIKLKAELLIMGTLNVLGHNNPFRVISSNTEMSFTVHLHFFHHFLDKMYSVRAEFIHLPRTRAELDEIMQRYAEKYIPGAGGSIDVVHMKWSACPAGDSNRAKGKEGYPTVAFEVISDFDRRILAISSIQFGTRNDKHIVKIDKAVAEIRDGWYSTVNWNFKDSKGRDKTAVGVYLICDGGYLRWPMLICPYASAGVATLEGYFSSNLESVRKDVECVFGILKKRWRIVEAGLRFRDIKVVEKIFVVSSMLHNFMLSEMEPHDSSHRVGRGGPIGNDGIWLQGPVAAPSKKGSRGKQSAAKEWSKRRRDLAEHLEYSKGFNKRTRNAA